jgi:diacylglycerol kinase family enzyme
MELDTGEVIERVPFAIVSKTTPYTFLGRIPVTVAPQARNDRALALTAFRSIDAVTLLGSGLSALGSGRFLSRRRCVDHRQDLRRLIVRSGEPFPYQVDGDDAGDTEHLDIEFEPDALTIVVP